MQIEESQSGGGAEDANNTRAISSDHQGERWQGEAEEVLPEAAFCKGALDHLLPFSDVLRYSVPNLSQAPFHVFKK